MLRNIATSALAVVTLSVSLFQPAAAERIDPLTRPQEWCLVNGGEIIEDAPNKMCCTDEGCIICNAWWQDCVFDPAYSRPNGTMSPDGVFPGRMTQPGRGSVGLPSMDGILVSPFSR